MTQNSVQLIGHLGKDAEVTTLNNGSKVAKFSIATNESYKDKQGNKVDKSQWHNVVCFGKVADVAEKYFKKGTFLLVQGKLNHESWEKDGVKKYATNVILEQFQFLGGSTTNNQTSDTPAAYNAPFAPADDFDPTDKDDLPW